MHLSLLPCTHRSEQHDEQHEQQEAETHAPVKAEPAASLVLSWPLKEGQCLPPAGARIEVLHLHAGKGMTTAQAEALLEALRHMCSGVRALYLTGHWSLGLEGSLPSLLALVPALEMLNLDRCQLGDAGAMALSQALAHVPLPRLTRLSLAHNRVGFRGLRLLASLLPRLCHVDLRGNLAIPADNRAFWKAWRGACRQHGSDTTELLLDTYPMPQRPQASLAPSCAEARAACVESARLYKQAFAMGKSARAGRGKSKGQKK